MLWEEVRALQYICNVADLRLICEEGIWCRNRVERSTLHPTQVADDAVVARRRLKQLNDRQTRLLDCVNLYFNARNAMLFALKEHWSNLVVLDVDKHVLRLPGVRVTPRNAAVGKTVGDKFVDEGLSLLRTDVLYRANWYHEDPDTQRWLKRGMQAEVLVPKYVQPKWLLLGRVLDDDALERAQFLGAAIPLQTDRDFFFGGFG